MARPRCRVSRGFGVYLEKGPYLVLFSVRFSWAFGLNSLERLPLPSPSPPPHAVCLSASGTGMLPGQAWVLGLSTWLRSASLLKGQRLSTGRAQPIGTHVLLPGALGVRDTRPKSRACQA